MNARRQQDISSIPIINFEGSDVPIVVHGVQHIFHPLTRLSRWPDGERHSRLILIGRDLNAEPVEQAFAREVLEQPR